MWSVSANNRLWAALALAIALAGCRPNPDATPVASQPSNAPIRNLTSFSEALRCMDQLFVAHGKNGFVITSTGIPDSTGKLSLGVRDMLITAISRMSINSQAFRYIDYESGGNDSVTALRARFENQTKIDAPQVYIRGSISQVDQAVETGKEGVGITTGFLDIGAERDRNVSLVTLELHLGDFMTTSLIPGIDANNTIAVVRSGSGVDAGAQIKKVGISFNFSSDKSEGSGQAVRTLIELGAIELLGKWTRVPYWTCLQIERTNPAVLKQLRDWWDAMPAPQQSAFLVAGLIGAGYLDGSETNPPEDRLREAIARYQTDRNLVPTGRVDFNVYEQLMGSNVRMSTAAGSPPPAPPIQASAPLRLTMASLETGPYSVGDRVAFRLNTTRTAYVRCYYQESGGTVFQLYPNRFQPEQLLQGNRAVVVPDPDIRDNVAITLTRPGAKETVACIATEPEIGAALPSPLRQPALTPLGARNLEEVLAQVRSVVPEKSKIAERQVVVVAR
jgi:hypothetical protein